MGTGSRTHFNCPRNVVWLTAHLNPGPLTRLVPSSPIIVTTSLTSLWQKVQVGTIMEQLLFIQPHNLKKYHIRKLLAAVTCPDIKVCWPGTLYIGPTLGKLTLLFGCFHTMHVLWSVQWPLGLHLLKRHRLVGTGICRLRLIMRINLWR